MKREILNDCIVTIENAKTKKMLWIEQISDDNNKVIKFETKKMIEYKTNLENKQVNPSGVKSNAGSHIEDIKKINSRKGKIH